MTNNATALSIMDYPAFVAALGQENTPPGGFKTLHQWNEWLPPSNNSDGLQVLDLACSTGFSGRTLSSLRDDVGRTVGLDISAPAIDMAKQKSALTLGNFEYVVGDAASLPFEDSIFDVVLGGCNFAFIGERESAVQEVSRVMKPGGYLFVSNFFYEAAPSEKFLDRMENVVGFRPNRSWTEEYWKNLFSDEFDLEVEKVESLEPVSQALVLGASIRAVSDVKEFSPIARAKATLRLAKARSAMNAQRAIQGLSTQLWRKSE